MMADRMILTIVTPGGVSFEGQVNYVNLPTPDGSLGILPGHAPMLCAVAEGPIKLRSQERGEEVIPVGEGIAEVINNTVTVLLENHVAIEEE